MLIRHHLTLDTETLISGSASFITSSLGAGSHAITAVYSGDSSYLTSTSTFLAETVRSPIVLTNPGAKSNTEGQTITTLSLSATDATSGTLVYAASGLPAGLQIDPVTGDITGTVAPGATLVASDSTVIPYVTTVTASNGSYSDTQIFTWTINSPVVLTNPGTQTATEGDTISLSLSATDATMGTLSYAAVGLPGGLKINTSTGAITGTMAIGTAGPYFVTVTAADGTYSDSKTFQWQVANPVTMAVLPNRTDLEGASPTLAVSANSSGTLAFTATGLPAGMHINKTTGSITGTLAAGASDSTSYSVTVVANDGTYSAYQSFTWFVKDPISFTTPADQTTTEGDSGSLTVVATDAASGTITYGAVNLPAGLSINSSTGAITGTVSTGAAANGPYTVILLAADGTYHAETSFTWTINGLVTVTAPANQTNNAGDTVSSLAVTATGSGTLSYSATQLPAGLTLNSSTGIIGGTLTVAGFYQTTVTATNGTDSASADFSWEVDGPITISGPGNQYFNAGDVVSVPVTAADTAVGTLAYAASGLPSGLSINSSTGVISGTLSTGLSAGVYTTILTVDDGTNTTTDSFTWAIAPVSTVAITNPGAQSTAEGGLVSWALGRYYTGGGTLKFSAAGLPAGLSIDPASGIIAGIVVAGASSSGPYTTLITATDGTDSDSQIFVWTITSPLTLTKPTNQSTAEGASGSLSLSTSYSGGGSIVYAALGLPSGLHISSSTGAISGTVAVGASGPYSVTVQAAVGSYTAQQTFTWTVTNGLVLTAPTDQTGTEGDSVSLSLSTTYSGGGTVSYTAQGLPAGLAISTSTGTITGTLAANSEGSYSVTVVAQDGTTSSAQSFTWTVNSPITVTTPADQTSAEGGSVSLSISASDSTSGTLRYVAVGLPNGLVINATTGAITGTLPAGSAGSYSVTIGVNDSNYVGTTTFSWVVDSPVAITTPDDQTNNEGDTVSLTVLATDSTSGTLSFTAANLPSGLSINSSSGAITGTISAGGSWQPTVTATDGTYTNTISFAWDVSSQIAITEPGSQSGMVGDTVSFTIAATDNASGTLSFSASSLPTGLSLNSSTGLLSGTISSGADTSSPYTSVITVTDGTNTAIDTFTWYVSPAGAVQLANPGAQTNAAGDMLALSIQATDSTYAALDYTVTGLPTGLYYNPATGMIFGTIDSGASSGSPYSVTVTADDGTNSANQTFSWTVNAAGTVTLVNPGDQTTSEGGSVSLAVTAADTGAGTLRYVAFGLPAGLKIDADSGAISGTVSTGAAGSHTVTVVTNDGTYSAKQSFVWTINSSLTLTTPDDQTNSEADTVSLSLTTTYTGGGTLSYAAVGLPAGLSIDPTTGDITGTLSAGQANSYSVTLIVGDGTSSAVQSFNWTVNSPITITAPDTQSNTDGETISTLTISAVDATSGTLNFSALNLPTGLSINATTGAITGTIAAGASGIGTFSPTIIVSNGTYASSLNFEWDVSSPITLSLPTTGSNVVGDTFTGQVSAIDATSGTPVFTSAWLPMGLTLNSSTGAITGTLTSDAAAIGSFSTLITVSDGTYSTSQTLSFSVATAGTVTLATPSNQSTVEGTTISTLSLTATGSGTRTYFTQGLPQGLVMDPTTGDITGTVAANAAASSPYTVTVLVTNGSSSAAETFTWAVSSPVSIDTIAAQTYTENTSVSLSLTASDASSGTVTFSAVGLPAGLKVNKSTGAITGTVALGGSGSYSVTVVAVDGTYSSSQTFTIAVGGPITLTLPGDQTSYEGGSGSGVGVSGTDAVSGTLNFSAVGLPAGLKMNPSTGAITGTIAARAVGTYQVQVTAGDGTYSITQAFSWMVNNPITITDPGVQNFMVGATVDFFVNAKDAVSGTLHYYASNLLAGLTLNSLTGEIYGTITRVLNNVGSALMTITVTDGTASVDEPVEVDVTDKESGWETAEEAPAEVAKPDYERMKLQDAWDLGVKAVGKLGMDAILDRIVVKNKDNKVLAKFSQDLFKSPELTKDKDGGPQDGLEWVFGAAAVRLKVKDYTGAVVQIAHLTLTVIPMKGKGNPIKTDLGTVVEAFGISNGLAAAPDLHLTANIYPSIERKTIASYVIETEFEVGAADTYAKKPIPQTAYIRLSPTVPAVGDIGWTGAKLKYKMIFTWDPNGGKFSTGEATVTYMNIN